MKTHTLLLTCLISQTCLSQYTLQWSDTSLVNSNQDFGNTRPKITVVDDDIPIVMWGRSNNKEVYVSRHSGGTFGSPLKVTPNGMNTFVQSWAGPDMASSGDTVFVVFKSQPEAQGYVYSVRSTDGGTTFGDTVRVAQQNWSRFPAISVRPGGHPVVTYMQFDSNFTEPHYVVCSSNNAGQSYSQPVSGTSAPGEACDCCPGHVVGTSAETILLFRNNDNNIRDIWATVSTDSGQSFSTEADIDNNSWLINACPSTGPDAVVVGDSLVAVWMSAASGFSRANIGVRDLATLSNGWNSEITPGSSTNQNFPKIAGNRDTIGMIWQDYVLGTSSILFTWSVTGASGLVANIPDTVNVTPTGFRSNPDVAYHNGVFHMTWQDNSADIVVYRTATIGLPDSTVSANTIYRGIRPKKLNVYPNPSNGFVWVEHNSEERIVPENVLLYNSTGKIVEAPVTEFQTRLQVEVGHLPKGLYIIALSFGNKWKTVKLQVE